MVVVASRMLWFKLYLTTYDGTLLSPYKKMQLPGLMEGDIIRLNSSDPPKLGSFGFHCYSSVSLAFSALCEKVPSVDVSNLRVVSVMIPDSAVCVFNDDHSVCAATAMEIVRIARFRGGSDRYNLRQLSAH